MEELPVHPAVDISDLSSTLRARLDTLERLAGGIDPALEAAKAYKAELVLVQLQDIATYLNESIKAFGVAAVLDNQLSRKRISEIVGVHQMTVGRWVKDASESDGQSNEPEPRPKDTDSRKAKRDEANAKLPPPYDPSGFISETVGSEDFIEYSDDAWALLEVTLQELVDPTVSPEFDAEMKRIYIPWVHEWFKQHGHFPAITPEEQAEFLDEFDRRVNDAKGSSRIVHDRMERNGGRDPLSQWVSRPFR